MRVLTVEAGTAACMRVLIEHHDGVRTWSTVGVSENMISASWQALSDGARYALLLRKVAGPARAEGKAG